MEEALERASLMDGTWFMASLMTATTIIRPTVRQISYLYPTDLRLAETMIMIFVQNAVLRMK